MKDIYIVFTMSCLFLLPYTLDAQTGTHLSFDGLNDYISATQQTTVKNNFTIEFWANPTATTAIPVQSTSGAAGVNGQKFIIFPLQGSFFSSTAAGAGIAVGTNGICVLEHADFYLPSLLTWSGAISGWTHIAIVYTNKQPSLYINGVLTATGLTSLKTDVYVTTNSFGGGSYGYFSGNMDELRIWNTSLSAADILSRKNCELNGNESGLVNYYKFNQGTASGTNTGVTTLTDATTNANNGTLNNFILTGATSNWVAGSPVTTGNLCFVLPITLLKFNGKNENGDNLLYWTTTSESNSSHFEVQYSTDGKVFEALGTVAATGKSNNEINYNFIHNTNIWNRFKN